MPSLYLYEPIIRANANCLVAVISGCRTYNDEAIIKEFGSKEANPLKPINLTLTLGIVSLTNKTF
ncbi:hypothetical protein Taiwan902_12320 [Helicobacter pylori]